MQGDPRGSPEPRVCLAFRGFQDLGDHLAQLEKKVLRELQGPEEPQDPWDLLVLVSPGLRAKMGREDRLDSQEHQVKRGLVERRAIPESVPVLLRPSSLACRVLRDSGWAAPRSRVRRVPQVSPDPQVPPVCLEYRECPVTTVCQDSLGSLPSWDPCPLSSTSSRASVETVPRAR